MSSRIHCWLHGHDWGEWSTRRWQNIVGVEFELRWCKQCGATDRRPA